MLMLCCLLVVLYCVFCLLSCVVFLFSSFVLSSFFLFCVVFSFYCLVLSPYCLCLSSLLYLVLCWLLVILCCLVFLLCCVVFLSSCVIVSSCCLVLCCLLLVLCSVVKVFGQKMLIVIELLLWWDIFCYISFNFYLDMILLINPFSYLLVLIKLRIKMELFSISVKEMQLTKLVILFFPLLTSSITKVGQQNSQNPYYSSPTIGISCENLNFTFHD